MLREIFRNNPNIIINNDIDGFLSGMILQKYYNCKIVGFSNSNNKVWVTQDVRSIYDPVYIDMYVNKPEVICIDQHIVADTQERLNQILAYGTKINPNLQLAQRTLNSNYTEKYPFGTVHYLIYLMGKEGVNVEFRNLSDEVRVNIANTEYRTCPGQVLLRADDALYNTLTAYPVNAAEWWTRLSGTSIAMDRVVDYKNSCNNYQSVYYENQIGKLFLALRCKRNSLQRKRNNGVINDSDGSFESITLSDVPGVLSPINSDIKEYVRTINFIMGMELHIPDRYILHKAEIAQRSRPENMIDSDDLFSYAFVSGPANDRCFSYTRNMR